MKVKTKRKIEKIKLDEGYCYLVKEEKPHLSCRLFEDLTAHSQGLFVTRIYPEKLKGKLNLGNSKVIWLSHAAGKDCCHPSALSSLTNAVIRVLEKKGTVLIDGLEYLVIQNGFNQSLQFVEHLNEFVMKNRGIVLIPINPNAFDQKELALLERNLEVIEAPLSPGRKDISSLMEDY